MHPYLNSGDIVGQNITYYYSFDDPLFGLFAIYTDDFGYSYTFKYWCWDGGWATRTVSVNESRCVKVAESMGGSCSGGTGSKFCYWS